MNTYLKKEKEEEISTNKGAWTVKRFFGTVLSLAVAIFVLFNMTGCTPGGSDSSQDDNQIEVSQDDAQKDTVKIGDDGVNAGIAPDDVSAVSKQKAEDDLPSGSTVSMSVEDYGRSDPFLPEHERMMVVSATKVKPKPSYDLLPPPEAITEDTTATEVITTKVSGILYDKFNPSAILNINNSDYLVRAGDIVNDYKVLSIEKNYVTVQYGANVYKAGVVNCSQAKVLTITQFQI